MVMSHTNVEAVFSAAVVEDNKRGGFYVVRAMPVAGQRANRRAFSHVTCVSCPAWSVPRL